MSQAGGVEHVLSALLAHLLKCVNHWAMAPGIHQIQLVTLSTLIIINLASDHEATHVLMTMIMNFSFCVWFYF